MPRPCPRDWRTLRVDGFLRRRPLVREQKRAPRDALVLSVAGVTAIMLIESLILLILY